MSTNLSRFPLGAPQLEILPGKHEYPFRLTHDFVYRWPGDKKFSAFDVCCPAGYCTDLLSIPKILWPLISPFGPGCWAAIPHDVLFSTEWGLPGESVFRRVLRGNRILRQAAIDSGANPIRAWILYSGVQVGGIFTWLTHRKSEVKEDLTSMYACMNRWNLTKNNV